MSEAAGGTVKKHMQVHRGASGRIIDPWDGRSVQDLHREYSQIFKYGNRNAASHLWTSFLIDRAIFMPKKRFLTLAGGYCAVSGSPVQPSDATRYKLRLARVDGLGKQAGFMYYCCWPCVCDTQDFIKVDTKTIQCADGSLEYSVAVLGNPCDKPSELTRPFTQPFDRRQTTIQQAAAEVRCGPGGQLEGATLSDHGYIIVSLFFDASKRTHGFQDEIDFEWMCQDRKNHGYNSGMGEIFRRVAAISPVEIRSGALTAPKEMSIGQLRAEIARRGLAMKGVLEKSELISLLDVSQVSELRKLSVRQLRAEARRRGLDLHGIADKEDVVNLLVDAFKSSIQAPQASDYTSGGQSSRSFSSMSVRSLRAEVAKLGLDSRGLLEKQDYVRLLETRNSQGGDDSASASGKEVDGAPFLGVSNQSDTCHQGLTQTSCDELLGHESTQ